MVAFVTLFLGLIVGLQTIEVAVDAPAASVELVLDGKLQTQRTDPPWVFALDLGLTLEPHHLVAVARDTEGQELGRAEQWLNLPHKETAIELILSSDESGMATEARVVWETTLDSGPIGITASFDGSLLEIAETDRIPIPPNDPDQLHLLQVELEFPDNFTAATEKVFGGFFSDEIETELTAVPVFLDRDRKKIDLEMVADWLVDKNGNQLEVVAVEKGVADVVLVRDLGAQESIDRLVFSNSSSPRWNSTAGRALDRNTNLRFMAGLRKDQRLRFLYPVPRRVLGRRSIQELFDTSGAYRSASGGLPWLMTQVRRSLPASRQRLADAVAVAGLKAAQRNHRRAVVLIVGSDPIDGSIYTPEITKEYLSSLRVPLFVWSATATEGTGAWDDTTDASSLGRLAAATKELVEALSRQRIVWIRGRHLPQEVLLRPDVPASVAM